MPSATSRLGLLVRLLALASALWLCACGERAATQVISLTDFGPRRLEPGDRVQLVGQNFPAAADVRRVTITLRGVLARPGLAPCSGPVEFSLSDPPPGSVVTDARTGNPRDAVYAESAERLIRMSGPGELEFTVTEEMVRALTHCPGERTKDIEVPHATLSMGVARSGSMGVSVRFDGLGEGRAIGGTLRGVVVDLHAPPARRITLEPALRQRGARVVDFLGITLAQAHPTEGLRVAYVRPDSPAARAGIVSNDVITRVDGLNVTSVADMAEAPDAQEMTLSVLRGDILDERVVSLEGLSTAMPTDMVLASVLAGVLLLAALCLLWPRSVVGAWFAWLRARALPGGVRSEALTFPAWMRANVKSLMRRDVSGLATNDPMLLLSPWALVAAVCGTIVMVPFGPMLFAAPVDVTSLLMVAVAFRLVSAGLDLRGMGPKPRVRVRAAQLGRALAAALPGVVTLALWAIALGTLRLEGLVGTQGGAPWQWNAVRTPLAPVAALLAFTAVMGVGSARVSGASQTSTEALGYRMAGASQWLSTLLMSACVVILFAGGWQLPGQSVTEMDARVSMQMIAGLVFSIKVWSVALVSVWLRARTPRLDPSRWVLSARWMVVALVGVGACGALLQLVLQTRAEPRTHLALGVGTSVACVLAGVLQLARWWQRRGVERRVAVA